MVGYWLTYGLFSLVVVLFIAAVLLRLFAPQRRMAGFPRAAVPNEAQRRHIAYAGTYSARLARNRVGSPGAAFASSMFFPVVLLVISGALTLYAFLITSSSGILFLVIPIIYTLFLMLTSNRQKKK